MSPSRPYRFWWFHYESFMPWHNRWFARSVENFPVPSQNERKQRKKRGDVGRVTNSFWTTQVESGRVGPKQLTQFRSTQHDLRGRPTGPPLGSTSTILSVIKLFADAPSDSLLWHTERNGLNGHKSTVESSVQVNHYTIKRGALGDTHKRLLRSVLPLQFLFTSESTFGAPSPSFPDFLRLLKDRQARIHDRCWM